MARSFKLPILLGLTVGALAAPLLLRASTPKIDPRVHPRGLATLEQVTLHGSKQWVLIRTEDVTNPVVLFVHGGPGTSQLGLMRRNTQPLEKHFTVVNWDQRGAGKSFDAGRDGSRMTMADFVDDIIELSSQLAARFHQERIVLVGHSWGSAIGMLAVAKRPDLFAAYVGIGQVSSMPEGERISYDWTLEEARRAGDTAAVDALIGIGPPPYTGDWRSKLMTERRLLGRFGGEYHGSRVGALGVVLENLVRATEYTVVDRINFFRGILASIDALFHELLRTDLFADVPEVKVPVYFCLGRHDYEVPSPLAAEYFDALKAPKKQLVWFESSAHMPHTEERAKFHRFMIETVLPGLREEPSKSWASPAAARSSA
jgi:pimeloyl-ACP methyl ester carboxylesterase